MIFPNRFFPTWYAVGNTKIRLPKGHRLPEFQSAFRLYDRFLPILAQCLPANKTVLDIGANVGDTAISMLPNTEIKIFCLEPSDYFFPYLQKNVGLLSPYESDRITLLKSFVGTNKIKGKLDHNRGTATIDEQVTASNENQISLNKLLSNHPESVLVKVDTDGFDYDVLLSGKEELAIKKPLLYWENDLQLESQKRGFFALYKVLEDMGYRFLFIFDNFGNILLTTTDFNSLRSLCDYLMSMVQKKSKRTFYYFDALAATDKTLQIAENALKAYREKYQL